MTPSTLGRGHSTQAKTRAPPVKAPESFSEPPFSLPTLSVNQCPRRLRSPRSKCSGCAEDHVAIFVTVRRRAGAPEPRGATHTSPSGSSRAAAGPGAGIPGRAHRLICRAPDSAWGCAGKSRLRESGSCALVLVLAQSSRPPGSTSNPTGLLKWLPHKALLHALSKRPQL